jgi:hypothetical protein
VNGLEKDLGGEVEVVRVDLNSNTGQEIAGHYDVTSAGTTILLDGSGAITYKHKGFPERKKIMATLRKG